MADSSDIRNFPRFRPGDALGHHHINGLVDAFRGLEVRGVGVRQDGNKIQIMTPATQNVILAAPGNTIAAASGSTPVKASATIMWLNPSSGNVESTGHSIEAFNVARTSSNGTGAIRSGQMCLVFQDQYGSSIIVPIEC